MLLLGGAASAWASIDDAVPPPLRLPTTENTSEVLRNAFALEGSDTPQSLTLAREALERSRRQPGRPGELAALLEIAKDLRLLNDDAGTASTAEVQARYEQEARSRKIQLLQRDKDLRDAALALAQSELIRARTQYTILAVVLAVVVAVLVGRLRFNGVATRRNLAESRAGKERAERELRESEARFRGAFDYSALGLALVARDGRWLRVNRAICHILGYTVQEMLSTTFQAITHPDDLADDLTLAERLLRGEIPSYHLEKRYFHKAGHIVWTWLDVSVVRDERGQPRYFVSQVQDITERKHAAEALQAAKEEAERANNAKSEFLSRTSHELRTPLNAILGFGQLLEIENLTPRQHQSVDHVMTAGRHLLGLIDDVLDIARIENGTMTPALEPVCMAGAAREALELVRPLAGQVSVVLRPSPEEESAHVAADPRRLRQILLNLLSNAIKYNRPPGEVALGWQTTDDGKRVRIEVADTGIGMAPEDYERIFSPFTRLPASEQVEGTGLGLPLSRALAEGMGGTISVRSVLGQGSVFTVELAAKAPSTVLPRSLFDGVDTHLAATVSTLAAEDLGEGLLLYIEDNLANLQLVERLVEDHAPGLRLISAMQGRMGLELASRHRPDLILLDLNLPDMSGAEVLRALRQQPETAAVPVVVISADATLGQIRRLRMLGSFDYLPKPFVVGDLLRTLSQVLRARATA